VVVVVVVVLVVVELLSSEVLVELEPEEVELEPEFVEPEDEELPVRLLTTPRSARTESGSANTADANKSEVMRVGFMEVV
jgi:hypothetical protein